MTNVLFNVVDLVEFSVSHGLVTLSKVRTSLYILFHGILISLHKLKLLLKFPVYHQPTHPPTHPPGSRLWCCPRVVFQLYHLTLLCLLKTWVARPLLHFLRLWCHPFSLLLWSPFHPSLCLSLRKGSACGVLPTVLEELSWMDVDWRLSLVIPTCEYSLLLGVEKIQLKSYRSIEWVWTVWCLGYLETLVGWVSIGGSHGLLTPLLFVAMSFEGSLGAITLLRPYFFIGTTN